MDNISQEVKNYLDRRFGQENALLHAIRTQTIAEGLPDIQIPIYLGQFLYLLATVQSPDRILEIGTLGGYSTGWLVKGLNPHGKLITLELNRDYAASARRHLDLIGETRVEVRVGHAIALLAQLAEEKVEPFDLIFIDADKENYSLYLDWAIRLSRKGALILIDNLIPKGDKVGYPSHDQAKAVYEFNDYLALHPALEVAVIPTLVGAEGRLDGFAITKVK